MLKLKQTLTATAAALLFTLAGTAAAQAQEQQKADRRPPPQDVNVTNVVPTHPGAPPGAFSVFIETGANGGFNPVPGPEAEGTSFAVTSFTVTNNTLSETITAYLWGLWGTTSDCASFQRDTRIQRGPDVKVPPRQTLHLTFPQPVIFSAKPGPTSCLAAVTNGSAYVYVVGYRLPPAAPQLQQ
jgi:hypothetical protein